MTYLAAIWAQIQHFKLVNHNRYSIYELLDNKEKLVMQNQIQEHIANTDENLKHSCHRSLSDGMVLMVL